MRDWYAALHRITGSMALLGVNPMKMTREHLKEWIAALKTIIKEMESDKILGRNDRRVKKDRRRNDAKRKG